MGELQFNKQNWILEEVLSGRWDNHYKIDKNAPFSFKLQDIATVTRQVRNEIKAKPSYQQLYNEFLDFISRQNETKLWVKLEHQIIQMSLLDVYQCFLKFLKDSTFEDQLFNVNAVSFLGPQGPFTDIALIECLNDRLINQFIFNGVIQNKLPTRKFRVHTDSKLLIEFGAQMELQAVLNMKQITDSGILFSTTDGLVIQELSKSDVVKFYIDTRGLKEFVSNNLKMNDTREHFFYSENQLRYFFIEEKNIQKNLSFRSNDTNEFFLFCRYHHMLESDIPHIFLEFAEKLDDYFRFIVKD